MSFPVTTRVRSRRSRARSASPGPIGMWTQPRSIRPVKVDAAVDRYHRLWPCDPQQKRELVNALQRRGLYGRHDGRRRERRARPQGGRLLGGPWPRVLTPLVTSPRSCSSTTTSRPCPRLLPRASPINNLQRSAALFLTKTLFLDGSGRAVHLRAALSLPAHHDDAHKLLLHWVPEFVLALRPNGARSRNFLANVLKRALPRARACWQVRFCAWGRRALLGIPGDALHGSTSSPACAVGVYHLIWPSQVALPRHCAVLCSCSSAGLAVGVVVPGFFSIAHLKLIPAQPPCSPLWDVCCSPGSPICSSAAREGEAKLATGFGRGVRVSVRGRYGGRKGDLHWFERSARLRPRSREVLRAANSTPPHAPPPRANSPGARLPIPVGGVKTARLGTSSGRKNAIVLSRPTAASAWMPRPNGRRSH